MTGTSDVQYAIFVSSFWNEDEENTKEREREREKGKENRIEKDHEIMKKRKKKNDPRLG